MLDPMRFARPDPAGCALVQRDARIAALEAELAQLRARKEG